MISLRILCFAHARDLLGFAEKVIPCPPTATPREVLLSQIPRDTLLPSETWRIALDHEYANWDSPIGQCSEMAVLPPVSGG
jgi:molybdopterin converting factor small subunit